MKNFLFLIFGVILGCGSSGDDKINDDQADTSMVEHPMKGRWISNCFKSELHTNAFINSGLDDVWMAITVEIHNGQMDYHLKPYFGSECLSQVSGEIDLSGVGEDRSGEITISTGHLSYEGYEYASYLYNGAEESSSDVHIAIIDGIPYWVRFDLAELILGSGERRYYVLFEVHFSRANA